MWFVLQSLVTSQNRHPREGGDPGFLIGVRATQAIERRRFTHQTFCTLRRCKAATAGKVLPSKNSKKAPPPVEI